MSENGENLTLPVLPLKTSVLFPNLMMPLVVGRSASIKAVEAALATEDKTILVGSQKDPMTDDPKVEDLYHVATRAVVKKMERAEDVLQIIVQGIDRVKLEEPEEGEGYLRARATILPTPSDTGTEIDALQGEVLQTAREILEKVNPQAVDSLTQMITQVKEPLFQVYLMASMMALDLEKEQSLLGAETRLEALRLMHDFIRHESQVLDLRQQIASQAASEMSQEQREYLLRRQLKAIQEELGEKSGEQAEIDELRTRLEEAELPEAVRKEAERELGRLERIPPAAPDYQVTRSYLDLILELPWTKTTEDNLDLKHARQILDEDHYALKEVKERIIEHLAVLKLNPGAKAPILCFVGPPGVGKTSLGKSIARSLGRKFERLSLGGMHDESELRGHRRTYIGSMPGRIVQAVRRAEVRNPLIMLDEVDKLGRDFRGDPGAALLEILDPAQNFEFRDNYLDLPFDLSKVFFITTANTLDSIPRPLLDRMEVLRVSGYSDEEKEKIARTYLLPRQIEESGLKPEQITIPDDTLLRVIRRYTREAGVRELERVLGSLCRKVATRFAEGDERPVTIKPEDLPEMLGREKFLHEDARKEMTPGVAAGMAYTQVGGEILYVEAVLLPESKGLTLTGQLGEVMKESATTALSIIKSMGPELEITSERLKEGVHIHVPAGATPKDGPSAGVTMATALASLYSGYAVQKDLAMTGEITLSGLVLPVGGIKEKVLAAHRAGITHIILPKQNEQDLMDLPDHVREELKFSFAERIEEVLNVAIPQLADRLAVAMGPVAG